ncbi:CDP-alcohol phosphatidyltransferase family protein [Roseococcus sp. DSY-14]|uniref:CDP-alcohol phosphatidyltransferase family protein n=1 Tax=Roseococcus sp. DSY-14 TaxID=3369650 RepID=UPI00387AAACB
MDPARPRLRERLARRPWGGPSLNRMIPNILTMMGLVAGLVAIRFAIEGRFPQAAAFIVAAGVIDGLDGRIARLLKGTSRFGAEFDSLADFLSFGVAPAMVLYLWTLNAVGPLGFVPCVMFAVCSSLRLARFNAASIAEPGAPLPPPRPPFAGNFFTGVPAPAGAGLALFPIFASLAFAEWGWDGLAHAFRHPLLAAALLLAVGGLMVSTVPSWSAKRVKVPPGLVLPLMLAVGGYVAVLLAEPWAALAAAGVIYAGVVVASVRAYRRMEAEWRAGVTPPPG